MKYYSKKQEDRKVQVRNKSEDNEKQERKIRAKLKKWDSGKEDEFEWQ